MNFMFHASLQDAKITKTKEKAKKTSNALSLWLIFSNFVLSYNKFIHSYIETIDAIETIPFPAAFQKSGLLLFYKVRLL